MKPKSILLVEDDINLRNSIALILQRAGYRITSSEYICEEMEFINAGKFNLIISDIDIQETMDALLPKVRGSNLHMPILILTDQPITESELEYKSFYLHYLSKPIDPACILDCVQDILSRNNHIQRTNSKIHTYGAL